MRPGKKAGNSQGPSCSGPRLWKPWCPGGQQGNLIQGSSRIGTMSLLSRHTYHQPVVLKKKKKNQGYLIGANHSSGHRSYLPGTVVAFAVLRNRSSSVRRNTRCLDPRPKRKTRAHSARLLWGEDGSQTEASSARKTHSLCLPMCACTREPGTHSLPVLSAGPPQLPACNVVGRRTRRASSQHSQSHPCNRLSGSDQALSCPRTSIQGRGPFC